MRRYIKIAFVILLLIGLAVIYQKFDPGQIRVFPTCPFKLLTGFKCIGCGSQRTIHYMLNLKFDLAIRENVLIVVATPYLVASAFFDIIKSEQRLIRLRNILFGEKAIWIILAVMITFWILRNITCFEQFLL